MGVLLYLRDQRHMFATYADVQHHSKTLRAVERMKLMYISKPAYPNVSAVVNVSCTLLPCVPWQVVV